jgi:hypothetical protein
MTKYLFIGGEFNGQRREANGDKELVFTQLFANSWSMVCYVRQTWVQGTRWSSWQTPGRSRPTQEIYVLDSLSAEEATELVNRL